MSKNVKKLAFSPDQLTSLEGQLTDYARAGMWPDCPGLKLDYNYLTRLYRLSVSGTRMSRAFTAKGVIEICAGVRDPGYVILDLQEQWIR